MKSLEELKSIRERMHEELKIRYESEEYYQAARKVWKMVPNTVSMCWCAEVPDVPLLEARKSEKSWKQN